jgi:hypothetical protein
MNVWGTLVLNEHTDFCLSSRSSRLEHSGRLGYRSFLNRKGAPVPSAGATPVEWLG